MDCGVSGCGARRSAVAERAARIVGRPPRRSPPRRHRRGVLGGARRWRGAGALSTGASSTVRRLTLRAPREVAGIDAQGAVLAVAAHGAHAADAGGAHLGGRRRARQFELALLGALVALAARLAALVAGVAGNAHLVFVCAGRRWGRGGSARVRGGDARCRKRWRARRAGRGGGGEERGMGRLAAHTSSLSLECKAPSQPIRSLTFSKQHPSTAVNASPPNQVEMSHA